jgi:CRISPR-associated protein Cas2
VRYLLVCYDLSDDRLRDRVATALLRTGERGQESVFELAFATQAQEQAFLTSLEKLLPKESNVRAYRLSKATLEQSQELAKSVGLTQAPQPLRSVLIG